MATALQNQNAAPAVNLNPIAGQLANFKDFKAVGPPEFKGTNNHIEAQTWVNEMERVFEVVRVADQQKTAFATFMLKGEAGYWWEANKNRAGEGTVTWDRFKEIFFETYFPECYEE